MLGLAIASKHINKLIQIRETRSICLNHYIKILSKSTTTFSYFEEIFGYGLQFSCSPESMKDWAFSLQILRMFNFNVTDSDKFREKGREGSFRERGKLSERVSTGTMEKWKHRWRRREGARWCWGRGTRCCQRQSLTQKPSNKSLRLLEPL